MLEPVVKIAQLVKKFEDKTALNGISLEVLPGEMFGLSGPDGAGKTTLMRILCGLLDFQEGEVLDGKGKFKIFRQIISGS